MQVQEAYKHGKLYQQGLSLQEVASILRKKGINASMQQIISATNYLVEEGVCYSTVEDCYKLTCED